MVNFFKTDYTTEVDLFTTKIEDDKFHSSMDSENNHDLNLKDINLTVGSKASAIKRVKELIDGLTNKTVCDTMASLELAILYSNLFNNRTISWVLYKANGSKHNALKTTTVGNLFLNELVKTLQTGYVFNPDKYLTYTDGATNVDIKIEEYIQSSDTYLSQELTTLIRALGLLGAAKVLLICLFNFNFMED